MPIRVMHVINRLPTESPQSNSMHLLLYESSGRAGCEYRGAGSGTMQVTCDLSLGHAYCSESGTARWRVGARCLVQVRIFELSLNETSTAFPTRSPFYNHTHQYQYFRNGRNIRCRQNAVRNGAAATLPSIQIHMTSPLWSWD